MMSSSLLLPIVIPAVAGVLCLLLARLTKVTASVLVAAMVANLWAVLSVYKQDLALAIPLGGYHLALDF
ncbi:MAG TPA: hypothetical protein VMK12_00955, partial [Anaeromyxobacteraceae bacterium]|nr:hypothetical protein [Anaeromyxobacteraceae bacterium]